MLSRYAARAKVGTTTVSATSSPLKLVFLEVILFSLLVKFFQLRFGLQLKKLYHKFCCRDEDLQGVYSENFAGNVQGG